LAAFQVLSRLRPRLKKRTVREGLEPSITLSV
jgi:hypothetical protein